jgi:hypothetical protein
MARTRLIPVEGAGKPAFEISNASLMLIDPNWGIDQTNTQPLDDKEPDDSTVLSTEVVAWKDGELTLSPTATEIKIRLDTAYDTAVSRGRKEMKVIDENGDNCKFMLFAHSTARDKARKGEITDQERDYIIAHAMKLVEDFAVRRKVSEDIGARIIVEVVAPEIRKDESIKETESDEGPYVWNNAIGDYAPAQRK